MEPFQLGAEDWEQYVERVSQYFVANDIANDKKVAVLLTSVGQKAYSLMSDLTAPRKPAEKTYDELVALMKAHKPITIAEQFKFHRRNQGEGESVAGYMEELRKLADRCNFGEHLEEALRDRLVCGLRSSTTQKKLLAESELTLHKAMNTCT